MIDYGLYRIIRLSRSAYAAGIPTGDQISILRIFESFSEALEYIGYERKGKIKWI